MMSLWDALRMNMMISYQELVRTFPNFESFLFTVFTHVLAVLCQVCFHTLSIFQKGACSNLLLISRINKKAIFFVCFN
ncbi:hypothetical protein AIZ02_14305 [Salmonella enterica subsp. enterica serovar Typhimurium]|nr:hypothetical protein AIZ06_15330 [Salmonella enterica subsp. enterica serovar Typhimurium]KYJ27486.1 hypothetical protein AIZ03_13285 [Salmonella enterica subsp. enterica serovar Typhimurium]KYJ27965.1 hypothetical protein AIZ05_14175 [Salmonella enterica subsp. enterica serovar Typhimurium]KYJ35302.1 hypothetical protein AIZ02_14305 [Salmonella enterica subsp. enterica serovar Typhimurium]KYJ39225.1 hypothetical protein AIZ01_15030 [Salmonella enterica subsp. enterica serovar Typhimurium]